MPISITRKLIQKQVKMNRAVLDSQRVMQEKMSDSILVNVMAKTILLGFGMEVSYLGKEVLQRRGCKMLLAHRDFRDTVSKGFASDMGDV